MAKLENCNLLIENYYPIYVYIKLIFTYIICNDCAGYGAGGRLGIGGTDSVLTPTLLESIQHVFIKKVSSPL